MARDRGDLLAWSNAASLHSPSMTAALALPSATRLLDGTVLVTGTYHSSGDARLRVHVWMNRTPERL